TSTSRVLQLSALVFDVATADLTMTLSSGAALVLIDDDSRSGPALRAALLRHRVTHVMATPTVLATIADGHDLALETIVVGGEGCPPGVLAHGTPRRRVVNAYGPTEATVCATLSPPLINGREAPLGAPVGAARIYVLDDRLTPVPAGVPG